MGFYGLNTTYITYIRVLAFIRAVGTFVSRYRIDSLEIEIEIEIEIRKTA